MSDVNFDLPKDSKITNSFKLFKVSKMSHQEARNIKFGQQYLIQRVLLGTPPQEILRSLTHIL